MKSITVIYTGLLKYPKVKLNIKEVLHPNVQLAARTFKSLIVHLPDSDGLPAIRR